MAENRAYIISKCVELIRTFNPVIYSIDTFVAEHIGDITKPVRKPLYIAIEFRFADDDILKSWAVSRSHFISILTFTCQGAKPDSIFIQQVVYGWSREKAVIEVGPNL